MQVYKKLKILTARPNKIEQKDIKHHLYGVIDLNKKFSTGQWLELVIKKIRNIKKKKKIPILVGGTGLYFQSLINGLVKIPEIPLKFRNKVRLMSKREGQKKFYKKLLKLDPKIKDKFDPNDTQRSIRAYEIKSYTNISMYDWLAKTKSEFKDSDLRNKRKHGGLDKIKDDIMSLSPELKQGLDEYCERYGYPKMF